MRAMFLNEMKCISSNMQLVKKKNTRVIAWRVIQKSEFEKNNTYTHYEILMYKFTYTGYILFSVVHV